jgi:hypothetical protein
MTPILILNTYEVERRIADAQAFAAANRSVRRPSDRAGRGRLSAISASLRRLVLAPRPKAAV